MTILEKNAKYESAMRAIQNYQRITLLNLARPAHRPISLVGYIGRIIGIRPREVERNYLHCVQSRDAWLSRWNVAQQSIERRKA